MKLVLLIMLFFCSAFVGAQPDGCALYPPRIEEISDRIDLTILEGGGFILQYNPKHPKAQTRRDERVFWTRKLVYRPLIDKKTGARFAMIELEWIEREILYEICKCFEAHLTGPTRILRVPIQPGMFFHSGTLTVEGWEKNPEQQFPVDLELAPAALLVLVLEELTDAVQEAIASGKPVTIKPSLLEGIKVILTMKLEQVAQELIIDPADPILVDPRKK